MAEQRLARGARLGLRGAAGVAQRAQLGRVELGRQLRRRPLRERHQQLVLRRGQRVAALRALERDDADGPQVGGERVVVALHPLGRHVRGRADERLRHRHRLLQLLGDPKVGDAHRARRVEQDVGRLEVAVDDALRVQVLQPAQHLQQDVREDALRQPHHDRPALALRRLVQLLVGGEQLLERAAVHVAEREVHLPLEVEGVEEGHEVRVRQPDQHADLVEQLVPLRLVADVDRLERQQLAGRLVLRQPHGAAGAGPERLQRLELLERERR